MNRYICLKDLVGQKGLKNFTKNAYYSGRTLEDGVEFIDDLGQPHEVSWGVKGWLKWFKPMDEDNFDPDISEILDILIGVPA